MSTKGVGLLGEGICGEVRTSPEMVLYRGRGSISKVEGHWPKGALLYMTKIKRFYVAHEPNENF